MSVNAVQRRQKSSSTNELGQLLPIAGAVIGGMAAGPGGAMAGASQGAALGQLGQSALSMADGPQEQSGGVQGVSAAQRAMGVNTPPPQVDDPMRALQEAQVALANLPQEQQQQFAGPLRMGLQAYQRKQEGMA